MHRHETSEQTESVREIFCQAYGLLICIYRFWAAVSANSVVTRFW
jgi:hypothetical protein